MPVAQRGRSARLLFAAALLQSLPMLAASAAQLHWPLPADSTERNGQPQPMGAHRLAVHPQSPVAQMPVSPDAQSGLLRPYSGTPIDALNYHYDAYPTG